MLAGRRDEPFTSFLIVIFGSVVMKMRLAHLFGLFALTFWSPDPRTGSNLGTKALWHALLIGVGDGFQPAVHAQAVEDGLGMIAHR